MRAGVDLRLVPAALLTWALALVLVVLPVGALLLLGGGTGIAACAVVIAVVRRRPTAFRGEARRPRRWHGQALLLLAAATVLALTGAVQLGLREGGLLPSLVRDQATVRVVGTVRSDPVPLASPAGWIGAEERYRLELAVRQVSGRGRVGAAVAPVLVIGGPAWARVAFGAQIEVVGRLAPASPGERVVALLAARGAPRLVTGPGAVDRAVGRIRADLLVATDLLAPDPRGLVPGITIGDTARLPTDLGAAMQVAGLTHVTAVSGAHFAIIGASVLALAGLLGVPRRARVVVVAVSMAGLVLLVHPEPSVLRAAAMGAVGVGGLLLGRPSRAIPALAAAVICLLVADPWLARSYGFVLSVLATAGIVLLTVPITRGLARVVPERLGYAVAVPLAAQAACAPVIVLLNPALATYAVPANIAVAPALAPATVLGVLAALVAPWWPGGGVVLAQLAGWAAWWIAAVARLCVDLPAAQLPWPGGLAGAALLAAMTVTVGLGLGLVHRRRLPRPARAAAMAAIAVGAVCALTVVSHATPT